MTKKEIVVEYLDTTEGRNALFEAMKPAMIKCIKYLILKYEMQARAGLIGNLNLSIPTSGKNDQSV